MNTIERDLNAAAFRRMEHEIAKTFPHGQFVAIAGGAIVGDAANFMNLHRSLKDSGRDPRDVLIVQAGHDYPREAIIFFRGRRS